MTCRWFFTFLLKFFEATFKTMMRGQSWLWCTWFSKQSQTKFTFINDPMVSLAWFTDWMKIGFGEGISNNHGSHYVWSRDSHAFYQDECKNNYKNDAQSFFRPQCIWNYTHLSRKYDDLWITISGFHGCFRSLPLDFVESTCILVTR